MSQACSEAELEFHFFKKMPIVFFEVAYPAVSHLKLELSSTFSERSFQELSFGTIFRVDHFLRRKKFCHRNSISSDISEQLPPE